MCYWIKLFFVWIYVLQDVPFVHYTIAHGCIYRLLNCVVNSIVFGMICGKQYVTLDIPCIQYPIAPSSIYKLLKNNIVLYGVLNDLLWIHYVSLNAQYPITPGSIYRLQNDFLNFFNELYDIWNDLWWKQYVSRVVSCISYRS